MPTTEQLGRLQTFINAAYTVCTAFQYPLIPLCVQWCIESKWGEVESGKNNYFGLKYNSGPGARKRPEAIGFSMVPTTEYLTFKQIMNLPQDEAATITSRVLQPDGVTYKVKLKCKFADFASVESCIKDYLDLLQNTQTFGVCYKRWLNDETSDKDLNLLKCIAAKGYATAPSYTTLLTNLYNQLKRTIKLPNSDATLHVSTFPPPIS